MIKVCLDSFTILVKKKKKIGQKRWGDGYVKGLCLGELLGWFYLKELPAGGLGPLPPSPRQSDGCALAAGLAPDEWGGYPEAQPLQSGILFKYRKKASLIYSF